MFKVVFNNLYNYCENIEANTNGLKLEIYNSEFLKKYSVKFFKNKFYLFLWLKKISF